MNLKVLLSLVVAAQSVSIFLPVGAIAMHGIMGTSYTCGECGEDHFEGCVLGERVCPKREELKEARKETVLASIVSDFHAFAVSPDLALLNRIGESVTAYPLEGVAVLSDLLKAESNLHRQEVLALMILVVDNDNMEAKSFLISRMSFAEIQDLTQARTVSMSSFPFGKNPFTYRKATLSEKIGSIFVRYLSLL